LRQPRRQPSAPEPEDIQAIVGTGFAPLLHCDYWLLRITDAVRARQWLGEVLDAGLVKSIADLGSGKETHTEVVSLAFTHAGLARLGLREDVDHPFPSAFRTGMAIRERMRSAGKATQDNWTWADVEMPAHDAAPVDLLLAHYRETAGLPSSSPLVPERMQDSGLATVQRVSSCPSYTQRPTGPHGEWQSFEPFGFRDGLAQPVLRGLRLSRAEKKAQQQAGPLFEDRWVEMGEFVLGYRNEFGELSYTPDAVGWEGGGAFICGRFGRNGSYLAVRHIHQHAQDFRDFEAAHPAENGEPSVSEKMIGRRKNGESLVRCPFAPKEIDAFRYRDADLDGFQCPRGAHVRRANPRDSLGWDTPSGIASSKLHRLLRRGRVFANSPASCAGEGATPCGDAAHRESCGQGLFFMALNADIERQFEFVQQRWFEDPHFGDLASESDPLLGLGKDRTFSIPAMPVGKRITGLADWTTVSGGGYFFVPGISALRFLAAGCVVATAAVEGDG
jgi:putative iron-dependent peroxidase